MFVLDEAVDKLVRAGRIAGEARDYGASLVKKGASAREVCEEVESYIRRKGAQPAFPCNFSVNEVAAHYTPGLDDDVRLAGDEVVKVDVGAHIDGYIADTAVTVDLSGRYGDLLRAVREALENVVRIVRPNIRVYDIGRTVEATIKKYKFKPVRNLTGHTIGRYMIHAGESIPNVPERSMFYKRLRPGTLFAVEPFGTNGRGYVREEGSANIYSYTGRRPRTPLTPEESAVLEVIVERFKTLPFTPRWLAGELEGKVIVEGLKKLERRGVLVSYPPLVEVENGIVAQFEHTFLLLKDRVIVTTKLD